MGVEGEGSGESARTLLALGALSLATFTFVTTENIPVGLLPQIAHDLHRSRSATGYLVSGYALVVVVASIPLAIATRRVQRRRLLLAALAVFVLASALGAAAPDYASLMATRMAIALAHAVFWALVAAAAAALVPAERRGRALAVVFAGASLATVVGIPAVTWLGQQTSWRVATLTASGLGLVTLGAILVLLPGTPAEEERAATAPHADPIRFASLLVALGFAVTGTFALLTYVTAFLTSGAGFSSRLISPLLLVQGLAGALGVVAAARYAVRRPLATMASAVGGLVLALLALAATVHVRPAVVPLLALFGFSFSVLAVSASSRTLDVAPGNINVASAANSAVFNVGIGGGALLGGLLLAGPGVRALPLVGGLVVAGALAALLAEAAVVSRGSRGRRDRASGS